MPAGHLVELFGNISDSTFDGTQNFGPLPTGKTWGAVNDFYLLPGGCGQFGNNLNRQGFPKPVPLATLYSWLPDNAVHLESVPWNMRFRRGETGKATLQKRVERIFPDSRDCECRRLHGCDLRQKGQRGDRQRNTGQGCAGAVKELRFGQAKSANHCVHADARGPRETHSALPETTDEVAPWVSPL